MNNFKFGKDFKINKKCNFEIHDTVVIGDNVEINCESIKLKKTQGLP